MKYRDSYKYQLAEDFEIDLLGNYKWDSPNGEPTGPLTCPPFLSVCHIGVQGWNPTLLIERGYAWDGPSGPTFDTKDFMIPSLVHDALYQLLRNGFIDSACRIEADKELIRIFVAQHHAIEASKPNRWWNKPRMIATRTIFAARRRYVYEAVKRFGRKGATTIKEVFEV